jgi:hypothetical protein
MLGHDLAEYSTQACTSLFNTCRLFHVRTCIGHSRAHYHEHVRRRVRACAQLAPAAPHHSGTFLRTRLGQISRGIYWR